MAYPILYESITAGTIPQHNGLGILSDCISCVVEQTRNDAYELIMDYPITGIHSEEFVAERYLKVKPNFTDNPQLFKIDRISKVMNGVFTVYAKHISYCLSGFDITSGTASSIVQACTLLQNASSGFTITTDKTTSGNFKIDTPASVKSYFVGREGSILDVYGTADIKYDNFSVQFLTHAGSDRGVTIRYGKNLLELSQELGSSNLYSHVRCFYKSGDNPAVVSDKKSTGLELDIDRCKMVDVSSEYQDAPSVSALNTRAEKYIADNNLTVPSNNITLDFAQSEDLTGRVDLCDTVTIYYEALGITRSQVKCIRTKWDCIREKYIETEFGDYVPSAVDTIASTNRAVQNAPTSSFMAEAIAHATEMITGNLGGYVILHDANGDGQPDEILIMNTDDITTATQVWRWNKNGLGFAESYSGTYGTAITQDGKIVADYVSTGTLNADVIKAGILSDTGDNFSLNMTSGEAVMKNFLAKLAFYLVDANKNHRADLTYTTTNGAGLFLRDPSGNATAVMLAGSDNDSYFNLQNASGRVLAGMQCQTWGGGIYLNDKTSGKIRVSLYCTSTNGAINLYNSSDKNIINISNYSNGGNGGSIDVKNGSGTTVAWLFANPNNNGALIIRQSSGTSVIDLDGNNGKVTCVSLTQTSSRKVKKNIKPITDAQKILSLEAVSFDFKDEEQGTDKRGFIAEDVAKVLPNLVTPESEDQDISRPASLDYIGMIPYLQAVIKDQESRIQDLEKRLEALEKGKS